MAFIQFNSNAQVHKNAIGLRLSSPNFGRSAMSYQLGLNDRSRLDFGANLAFGFGTNSPLRVNGLFSTYYQRVWNIKGGLNWFAGAGVQYQFSSINTPNPFIQNFNRLSLGPQIGIEYDFNAHNVPLILSMDFRPSIGYSFNQENWGIQNNAGLSLRYTF